MRLPTYAILSDPLAPAKSGKSSLDILIALYNHFQSKRSVITEHFHFYKWVQAADETISDFDFALRMLANNCQFKDTLQQGLQDSFLWITLQCHLVMPTVWIWFDIQESIRNCKGIEATNKDTKS